MSFDARATTLGLLATTPTWNGQTRIVPGDPMHSLLVKLITNRGTDNPVANQMPPIASNVVDAPDTQAVIDWISKMLGAPGRRRRIDAQPPVTTVPMDASASFDAEPGDSGAPVSDAANDGAGE